MITQNESELFEHSTSFRSRAKLLIGDLATGASGVALVCLGTMKIAEYAMRGHLPITFELATAEVIGVVGGLAHALGKIRRDPINIDIEA